MAKLGITADDKRVVNGEGDINQLFPLKYPWAWQMFQDSQKNHWTPTEIEMSSDIKDYNFNLNEAEKHLYTNVMAFLSTADIIAMRNIGCALMDRITAPELQMYMASQIKEESIHTWAYQYCIESLNLDQGEIYNRYRVVPEINAKVEYANEKMYAAMCPDIDLRNKDSLKSFVISYFFFAMIFEGVWFYNGFSPIFALQRTKKMTQTSEQLQYIMRDECMHFGFGDVTIKQIMREENIQLDHDEVTKMFKEAIRLEEDYIHYVLPKKIMGYSAELHIEQAKFTANCRAASFGIAPPFPNAENSLPWLDEMIYINKEKNFFETRVTEYQVNSQLEWDD